ncbi:CRAL-TRIO domain-containing protein [Penicillium riverlandense]|uniref:CRAL-TRIO domain-containing protein n=1 Tax=Penicillium riverlandense TaxID=1903569 RepID=UPI00254817B6|nr:CRAL-TRIO domain-containing protein [Penicillium riverlandense]KAJ5814692.1 CRAL-TRIO domain-containing protein [Penicillium riverlandense]
MRPALPFRRCWFNSSATSVSVSVSARATNPSLRPPRHYSTRSPEPRESSSFWITFTLLAIGSGAALHNYYSHDPAPAPSRPPPQEPFLGVIDTLKKMPIEPAPGTVSTLTAEQEAKLQEFWVLVLHVFGIKPDDLGPATKANADENQSTTPKKPKRRWGLWGRSGEDDDDAKSVSSEQGISSSLAAIKITDGDDKYSQSKEFQKALAEMSPEEIRTAFWNMVKHDHPDALLLRFLRARKWDVQKALIMLISTMRWRLHEVHVDDDVMMNGEALALRQSQSSDPAEKKKGEEFLYQMRMGKSFLHGVDRMGRPICVVRVRLHRASEQSVETLERFTVYTIETARLLLAPPVETATIIFDMTDFTLANMDYTPVKFMIKCFEANYPESLGSVLIHKAPWIFSSIWSIIKGWLDPVVAAKIHFTKNREDLEQFIAPERLPKELEGDEAWEYEYSEIKTGENAQMDDKEKRDELITKRHNLAKEIQDVTIDWIKASGKKDTDAVSAAKQKREGLVEQLREQYWDLDPHIRARSLYDRLNIVQGGGKIEFYPPAEKGNGADEKAVEENTAAEEVTA